VVHSLPVLVANTFLIITRRWRWRIANPHKAPGNLFRARPLSILVLSSVALLHRQRLYLPVDTSDITTIRNVTNPTKVI
jgi:hypothetical protein